MLSNSVTSALHDFVPRLVELAQEREDLKVDRKELMAEMRERGIPMDEIVRLRTADPEKLEAKAEKTKQAAAFLGVEVYAEKVKPNIIIEDNDKKIADDRLNTVLSIDTEIQKIKEEEKDLYKQAKKVGLNKPTLQKVVQFQVDPQALDHHQEANSLLEAYLAVL